MWNAQRPFNAIKYTSKEIRLMKIFTFNNIFYWFWHQKQINPEPLGCQSWQSNYKLLRPRVYRIKNKNKTGNNILPSVTDRGAKRSKIKYCDLLAQCGTVCHLKTRTGYKLIPTQWWLTMNSLRLAFNVMLRRSNGEFKTKRNNKQKSSSICLCSFKSCPFSFFPPSHILCAVCVDVEKDSLFYS